MRKKQQFSKSDFTKSMLPQSRREIFRDVMQLHWQKLLLLGVIFFLFYLPILLVGIYYDSYVSAIYSSLSAMDDAQKQSAGYAIIQMDLLRSIAAIFLLILLSVALAGIARVIRQYAWEENVHIPTDFAKGIRDNLRQIAALAGLSGILYALCLSVYYTADFYRSSLLSYLSLLPIAISLLLVLPIFAISLVMIPVYSNKLGTTLKNAFFVYSRCLLPSLGFLLICFVIWVPALIPNFLCHIFGGLFGALMTPIALLAWTLFCYDRFDQHFNPLVYPELIGKGIMQ